MKNIGISLLIIIILIASIMLISKMLKNNKDEINTIVSNTGVSVVKYSNVKGENNSEVNGFRNQIIVKFEDGVTETRIREIEKETNHSSRYEWKISGNTATIQTKVENSNILEDLCDKLRTYSEIISLEM